MRLRMLRFKAPWLVHGFHESEAVWCPKYSAYLDVSQES
jgi:hypothetical protein